MASATKTDAPTEVVVPVAFEKTTKNTVRFLEEKENDLAVEKLGQIYVPNGTLGVLGFTSFESIGSELEIVIRRRSS